MKRLGRIRDGLEAPGFVRCRSTLTEVADVASATDAELWIAHDEALGLLSDHSEVLPDDTVSLLDVKVELARRALSDCRLCPNDCGADRLAGEVGACGVGAHAHVAASMVHLGEVGHLAPAWTIFLSGCTMRCAYCRKWELVAEPATGRRLDAEWFAGAASEARGDGARTLKLLGGTPEPHVYHVLNALRATAEPLPVVWESTMFMSPQCLRLVEGVVDLFVANVRYGNDECARELSGVDAYVEPALAALRNVMQWTDVTTRHLVLPGHIDCCTRPLAEMLEQVAPKIEMTLQLQYVPFWRAVEYPPLDRRLTDEERRAAVGAVSAVKRKWCVVDLA